jgi:hypothetical protein
MINIYTYLVNLFFDFHFFVVSFRDSDFFFDSFSLFGLKLKFKEMKKRAHENAGKNRNGNEYLSIVKYYFYFWQYYFPYLFFRDKKFQVIDSFSISTLVLIFVKFCSIMTLGHYPPFLFNISFLFLGVILAYKYQAMKALKMLIIQYIYCNEKLISQWTICWYDADPTDVWYDYEDTKYP